MTVQKQKNQKIKGRGAATDSFNRKYLLLIGFGHHFLQ